MFARVLLPLGFVRKMYISLVFPRENLCPYILDGFRAMSSRFSLGTRTLPWVLLRKNCFPYILDGFRAISLRFREENLRYLGCCCRWCCCCYHCYYHRYSYCCVIIIIVAVVVVIWFLLMSLLLLLLSYKYDSLQFKNYKNIT